ncbi:hypothetical protein BWQ96_01439 [Gracilariopsis chorda]|uniref:Uncharacterized protein n=1 Tax=Gracilariopsis chorda TaxID=448386 RepID=A0A2V3J3H3_9FLOR|nr:hypothetical protein BWQ96_01439 [Gracilariopsis chorda]|eukprot:PXF48883.1 hypothetical protein BWQ96_01439 [Gracilariopsis chorda]
MSNPLKRAEALCGEPDPFFAHFLEWQEDFAAYDRRQVHYRLIGSKKKEQKAKKYPVVYLGDAGVALASGETLELLGKTDRRILFSDLLGVGESQAFNSKDQAEWVDLAANEVSAVLLKSGIADTKAKTVPKLHIVAVGFGIEVADVLLKRSSAERTGYQVASVVAEGWSVPGNMKSITFADIQGEKLCATEGAEGGNINILRTVYQSGEWQPREALKHVSEVVPVLALRMEVSPSIAFQNTRLREEVLRGGGRLPHLMQTEECMVEIDNFLEEVESMDKQ